MLNLEPISIEHKALVDGFMEKECLFNGDYCFGNIFAWGGVLNTKVCVDGGLCAFVSDLSKSRMLISFPMGEGDKAGLVLELADYAVKQGKKPVLGLMPEKQKKEAEAVLGDKLTLLRVRDSDDYVYLAEKMITLSGKELHSKKNMLNGFLKNEYKYERITNKNVKQAREFCIAKTVSREEKLAAERFFDNYNQLELCGAILKINEKIVAATVAELRGDTVIIHIEKAEKNVRGAYAAINNLFLKNDMPHVTYVNREDDMGEENLRKAKLSYKPCFMVEKYIGEFSL